MLLFYFSAILLPLPIINEQPINHKPPTTDNSIKLRLITYYYVIVPIKLIILINNLIKCAIFKSIVLKCVQFKMRELTGFLVYYIKERGGIATRPPLSHDNSRKWSWKHAIFCSVIEKGHTMTIVILEFSFRL